jgi:acyl-CoA synthetase (AMP-forming)/AMP-acid ligase II
MKAPDLVGAIPLTVPALLAERRRSRGDHPLLICDDDVLTYADADRCSAALAKGLLASGVGPGAHVGMVLPNGTDFVVTALAAARLGAVAVPLSTFSTVAEFQVLLRGADVHTVIAANAYRSHDYVESLSALVPEVNLTADSLIYSPGVPALRQLYFVHSDERVGAGRSLPRLIERGATVDDEVLEAIEGLVRPSDRLVMVHTSGSTAAPKGVIHRHGALIAHLQVLNEVRRFEAQDILFCNGPFFWVGGYAYALLGTLAAGGTLVCSNAADPSSVLDLLERTKPTMCNGFVASVAALPKDPSFPARDLSTIRRGNLYPIMPEELRPADPELRHNMLGMTETGSVCMAVDDEGDQPEARRGSFGRPVAGMEAQVLDPDTGALCGTGEAGELCLRGPAVMEGYWGRERHDTFDRAGWYHTGDQFAYDADGFYYFKGRRGDMIKTSGANVSPREVEAAILDETGLVAHVLGLDDANRGQLVAAAVRVPAGTAGPDPGELRARLRARLSAYKVPQRILLLPEDQVPVMSSGKLDTRALKARFYD